MNTHTERASILQQNFLDNARENSCYGLVLEYLRNDSTIVYAFIFIILVHLVLDRFGLPLTRLPWNTLVYLAPSRAVAALDPKRRASGNDSTEADVSSMSTNFKAKSEAMQRILGLENNKNANTASPSSSSSSPSIASLFSPAKSFSGIVGNALLGARDNVPPGLGNWDNSCYQNSIIQGLASLRSFAAFLKENVTALAGKGSFSTHEALKDITERLNSSSNHGQKLWIPSELKSMSSWQQQDAQEYFSKVVEQIDREFMQAARKQTSNLGLKAARPEEYVVRAISDSKVVGETQTGTVVENASICNPLEGLLAQRVGCTRCGWTEGLSLIPFNCLTVPLAGNWACNIRECLDQYMDLEFIEGVECAKCTLLRARGQLKSMLEQIEGDRKELSESSQSPDLSNALKGSFLSRLRTVQEALEEEDFSDHTLWKKCCIPSKNRVSTTKSRQAVVARAPQSLVIHINRSLFDENTGMLRKNYAEVQFPKSLDLSEWCLGTQSVAQVDGTAEKWNTNPQESMIPHPGSTIDANGKQYELRALVTHYGRHENGHYICYRQYPADVFQAHVPEAVLEEDGAKEKSKRWFRLSDDDVQMVSEQYVMSQGGGFMLFYEAVESPSPSPSTKPIDIKDATFMDVERGFVSGSNSATPDNMSTASTDALTQDDTDSTASRTPSVSPPAPDRVIPSIEELRNVDFSKLDMRNDVDGRNTDGFPWSPSIATAT